jgi:Ca-activated chloride channel family protein
MFSEFHLIRPYWLLAILLILVILTLTLRRGYRKSAWDAVCDAHLLVHLLQTKAGVGCRWPLYLLLMSALLMIFALTGPSWSRYPVPTYHAIEPRILVLDMSEAMFANDVQPNRFSRAKFKLHDILARRDGAGQYGLIVYTGEPFVASPLTDDSQTIDALLPMILPDTMPVGGRRLDSALQEAAKLISQAGFYHGQVLVMTASTPTPADLDKAKALNAKGIHVSILPVLNSEQAKNPMFERFATAGGGQRVSLTDPSDDLERWLSTSPMQRTFSANLQNEVPVWRDEGRWLIIPALLCLLPVFRRGWLKRITS